MKLTHVLDYLEIMQRRFPTICKEDLLRIMNYGWKQYYLINSYGGDVMTSDVDGFWMYTGSLSKNSIHFMKRYKRKLATRLRVLWKRKKFQWDGYYYFALTDNQWKDYQALIHRRGRPRKTFKFTKIFMYKLLEECKLINSGLRYIFRVPFLVDHGFTKYYPLWESSQAELIETREPQKLKDILVTEYNYEIL